MHALILSAWHLHFHVQGTMISRGPRRPVEARGGPRGSAEVRGGAGPGGTGTREGRGPGANQGFKYNRFRGVAWGTRTTVLQGTSVFLVLLLIPVDTIVLFDNPVNILGALGGTARNLHLHVQGTIFSMCT